MRAAGVRRRSGMQNVRDTARPTHDSGCSRMKRKPGACDGSDLMMMMIDL
jgi:hypothetical protein